MAVTHSTNPSRNNPCMAINIRLTVQFPPMKSLTPRAIAFWMSERLIGSRMMTASARMRSVLAASIQ